MGKIHNAKEGIKYVSSYSSTKQNPCKWQGSIYMEISSWNSLYKDGRICGNSLTKLQQQEWTYNTAHSIIKRPTCVPFKSWAWKK